LSIFLLTLLLAGVSALYFYPTQNYLTHIATESRDSIDMHAHSRHAKLNPQVVKEDGSRDNSTAVSHTGSQDRFPLKKEGRDSRASEAQSLGAGNRVSGSPIKEPTIHIPDRSKPQRSEPPRYWPHDKTAEVGSQTSRRKEQRFSRGHFEVVRNSIAFEKPTRDSAIIATFRPGTWVRVEEKVGSYLHVRSLNDPWIRGYVHTEDAFFEYIGFDR
jgi:hypothetical protein